MLKAPYYTQYPNVIIDKFMKDMSMSEIKVISVIIRKTLGWHKDKDRLSLGQIQELTGLSKNAVKTGIRLLKDKDLIIVNRTGVGKGINTYFELNVSENDPIEEVNGSKNDIIESPNGSKSNPTKEKNVKEKRLNIVSKQILEFFNKTTNRNIRTINKYIYGRINEGFTLEDAQKVILYKWLQWKDDGKMKQYIRISTLFAPSHFEEYLSEAHEGLAYLQNQKYENYKKNILQTYAETGEKQKIISFEEFNGKSEISKVSAYS